jgi:hypothetical protein
MNDPCLSGLHIHPPVLVFFHNRATWLMDALPSPLFVVSWEADANQRRHPPMADKHRLKFKFPFFGEGEAEGLYAIAALVFVFVVVIVAVAMH